MQQKCLWMGSSCKIVKNYFVILFVTHGSLEGCGTKGHHFYIAEEGEGYTRWLILQLEAANCN